VAPDSRPASLTVETMIASGSGFRASLAERERDLTTIFWDSPLGLARIVVRELHRFRLQQEGVI